MLKVNLVAKLALRQNVTGGCTFRSFLEMLNHVQNKVKENRISVCYLKELGSATLDQDLAANHLINFACVDGKSNI